MEAQFELAVMDWYKRRRKQEPQRKIVQHKVINFEKVDNHICGVEITFDDGEVLALEGRVALNQTYGAMASKKWSVQAINAEGFSVLLRLVE